MPAAALPAIISGALGVAGLVAGNAEQKSALKNNENQQSSAIANAQKAGQTATGNYNAYSAAHPSPFTGGGSTVTGPGPQVPGQNKMAQAILAAAGQQAPTPVAAPAPSPVPQPANPGILSALLG